MSAYHLDPEWNDVDPLDLPAGDRWIDEPVDDTFTVIAEAVAAAAEVELAPSQATEVVVVTEVVHEYRAFGTGPVRRKTERVEHRVIRSQRGPK